MTESKIKYPHIEVQLAGTDGNVFALFGRVRNAMKAAGLSDAEIEAYHAEAMQKSYDHFLEVTVRTVRVR